MQLVIFDCDGVLVDSDRLSLEVQAEHLTRLGLPTTYEECVRDFLGIGMPSTLQIIAERLGRPVPDGWLEALDADVRLVFTQELQPVRGVVAALDAITLPTCVASSGSHDKMRFTLGLTDLYDRFAGRIYSGDEVERGKPEPDLFLHAAYAMGMPPTRCVVVEDSPAGVTAAKRAGMRVLAYAATTPALSLQAAHPDAVFTDMAELPSLLDATA